MPVIKAPENIIYLFRNTKYVYSRANRLNLMHFASADYASACVSADYASACVSKVELTNHASGCASYVISFPCCIASGYFHIVVHVSVFHAQCELKFPYL